MSHKSKRRKIYGVEQHASCYSCSNRVAIKEEKDRVVVECKLYGGRVIQYSRRVYANPYCGAYKPC